MGILIRLVATTVAVVLASRFIPGIEVDSWKTAFVAAVVLGLINLVVRPVLKLLALPITILTLGLFTLVINAFLFWLASVFVNGFEVNGFIAAFLGGLVVAGAAWLSELFTD
ncbi:phage holin family protein [Staphylospora marina]|uniref:phage holin family protein n=1 Tax=Staphylospora marina TaxID=2490858 RepID=UPI000F5B8AC2|nr:phage holin family protein [Staphylospora marina]